MEEPIRQAMRRPASSAAVMGIDPGFSSIGWAVFDIADPLRFRTGSIFHTEKATTKSNTLACDDNFVRARLIATELRRIVRDHGVRVICAEAMSFPRSSSVAAKVAMTWGILADISADMDLPMLQPTPQKVKKAVCGIVTASKDDIARAVEQQHPAAAIAINAFVTARAAATPGGRKKLSDLEHFWDSCAVVMTCRDSEHFRLMRRLSG